jgi:hypothetical protein
VKTRGNGHGNTRKPEEDRPVEVCLAELLDHLGIVCAHFARRGSADLQGFASRHPGVHGVADAAVPCGTGPAYPGAAGRAAVSRDRRPRAGRTPGSGRAE